MGDLEDFQGEPVTLLSKIREREYILPCIKVRHWWENASTLSVATQTFFFRIPPGITSHPREYLLRSEEDLAWLQVEGGWPQGGGAVGQRGTEPAGERGDAAPQACQPCHEHGLVCVSALNDNNPHHHFVTSLTKLQLKLRLTEFSRRSLA